MEKGKIKWFNLEKGYGFIELAHGNKDIFVHVSDIENMAPNNIKEGTIVEFEIAELKGKSQATKVRKVN